VSAVQSNLCRAPFDGIADSYDTTFTYSQIGQAQRALVWEALEKGFKPGDRVLDIGCGTGFIARELADRVTHVDALDISPAMIEQGKRLPRGDAPSRSRASPRSPRAARRPTRSEAR